MFSKVSDMFNGFGEEGVRGKQTKGKELHGEPLNLHLSPNFIKVINSREKKKSMVGSTPYRNRMCLQSGTRTILNHFIWLRTITDGVKFLF